MQTLEPQPDAAFFADLRAKFRMPSTLSEDDEAERLSTEFCDRSLRERQAQRDLAFVGADV